MISELYSNNKLLILSILILISNSSQANDTEDIHQYLKEFHSAPFIMMDRLPQQIISGKAVNRGVINFQTENLKKNDVLKFEFDQHYFKELNLKIFSLPDITDGAHTIVDRGVVNVNIVSLDQLKLTSSSLMKIPWADSYWPIYKGIIGIRYADPQFPDSKNFEDNLKTHFKKRKFTQFSLVRSLFEK